MKRFMLLVMILLVVLSGCGRKTEIIGVWEQETETTILGEGIEDATSVVSIRRFAFLEDGTGIQEHLMMDDSYPNAVRDFTWKLEGETLTLSYGEDHTEEFSAHQDGSSLSLENNRGSYDLTKVK